MAGSMNIIEARIAIVASIDAVTGPLDLREFVPSLDDPNCDVSFKALGIDSLYAEELCLELHERCGVHMDIDQLLQHRSLNRLSAFVAEASRPV